MSRSASGVAPRVGAAPTILALLLAAIAAVTTALTADEHAALVDTRADLCVAVVREMHTEIHKHALRKNGEDDIYETVPAICIAIVQNYTLEKRPKRYRLTKRAVRLDDEADEGGAPDPATFAHIMTLKTLCFAFTDEFQQELSELMYKETMRQDPDAIVDSFCSTDAVRTPPPAPKPPKRRPPTPPSAGPKAKKAGGAKAKADAASAMDSPPAMDELLRKYDTDGSISSLIEMERETPEAMLEADELAQVEAGARHIRCDVCRALSKAALGRAKKRKALRSEDDLSTIATDICVEQPLGPEGVPLVYPKFPGNPPRWGELYQVRRLPGGGEWRMERRPKGAPAEETAAGGGEYSALVMKHSMIKRACAAVMSDDARDLAETIFAHPGLTAAELGERFCAADCGGGGLKDEV